MKIDMLGYDGFLIQREHQNSKEFLAVAYTCGMNRIPYKLEKMSHDSKSDANYICVGSVEWVEKKLGKNTVPNYYPDFLKEYLHRKVWESNEWPLGKKVFIKPSDRYKRFTGFVTNGGYRKKKKGPYWCSDIVKFDNEWRYYVSNGKILCGEWYLGDEIECPDAPDIDISIPNDFCGTIDMGMCDKKMTLVEVNHPFACGWYGKNHNLYTQWLVRGWKYMKDYVSVV